MFNSVLKKIFGSRNERLLKQYIKIVKKINALEKLTTSLTDNQLTYAYTKLKKRFLNGESLDNLLTECFAYVREVSRRKLGMRHFDVQLIGGIALFYGKIAEMHTGEGKTLVATLPACLHALTGNSVHIITVNDYLAKRDAKWMAPIYESLNLRVGVIIHDLEISNKKLAYSADITYGNNNEFGFDYLRDNMAFSIDDRMQCKLSYAIVDEVDSILIDEARTPLIISGTTENSSNLYIEIDTLIKNLIPKTDYTLEEKTKQTFLTENGHKKVESILIENGILQAGSNLYEANNINLMMHINAALRAHSLYKLDVDYIIKDNEIIIVDEHTGRTMPGRRWSEGLHQAIEAKEKVKIQNENQTLASITFQNYFRLYEKLSGMTGTADTEAYEFQQIYGLEVIVIPTNKQNCRKDLPDLIYLTQEAKFSAIIKDIRNCVKRKQPVLVGTISIETSEFISNLLSKHKITHQILNAKLHEKEAKIIADAGFPGKVTIATNMAGRGTDIVLGGHHGYQEKLSTWQKRHATVITSGGLHIIGTERHESRRIDNQLRGRSGRQGDPGSTRFYLSVNDKLMRIFIPDSLSIFLNKISMDKSEAITASIVSRAIENAQRKVEGYNFDVRKQLLDFDNVVNDQRKVIYKQRNKLIETHDVSETIIDMQKDVAKSLVESLKLKKLEKQEKQIAELEKVLEIEFGQKLSIKYWINNHTYMRPEYIIDLLQRHFNKVYQENLTSILNKNNIKYLEKIILLNVLDIYWKDHLATMDDIRQSIHLRSYAQKDPKQEYKREAFNLFSSMLDNIKREVVAILLKIKVRSNKDLQSIYRSIRTENSSFKYYFNKHDINMNSSNELNSQPKKTNSKFRTSHKQPYKRKHPKLGRNVLCPCGSGLKYKQCHNTVSSKT